MMQSIGGTSSVVRYCTELRCTTHFITTGERVAIMAYPVPSGTTSSTPILRQLHGELGLRFERGTEELRTSDA